LSFSRCAASTSTELATHSKRIRLRNTIVLTSGAATGGAAVGATDGAAAAGEGAGGASKGAAGEPSNSSSSSLK
jgi:hypothetical protein